MFRDIIKNQSEELLEVTQDLFISEVNKYSSIEEALYDLHESFMEFYINNQEMLERSNLLESAETPGYTGWSPDFEKTVYKNIKYKGHILTLEYNHDLQTWFPSIRFRSVVKSLKYIKNEVDHAEDLDKFFQASKS